MFALENITSNILMRHRPLIQIYLSNDVSTSSDGVGQQVHLQDWQQTLYAQLASRFDEIEFADGQRYAELERLFLGLLFAHAIYYYDCGGKDFIDSNSGSALCQTNAETIRLMFSEALPESTSSRQDLSPKSAAETNGASEQSPLASSCQNHPLILLETHFIFSDITKSHSVVERLNDHYLQMQSPEESIVLDHDLAYAKLMALEPEDIKKIVGVDMSDDVLSDMKKYVFPLHLGHASQAECAYSKVHSCKLALAQEPNKNQLLKRAFLIQYFDIAGARAHKTGKIFLSDALFVDYNALYDFLNRLLSSTNHDLDYTKEQYLQYLSNPIEEILKNTATDELNQQIIRLKETPLYFEYFLMLAWQFRILQDHDAPRHLSLLANACLTEFKPRYSLGFWRADDTPETLQVILAEMERETPTYVPSIYQTLRVLVWPEMTKQDSPYCEFYTSDFTDDLDFTLKVGLQLIATGISLHSQPDPCCFNDINRQLQQCPSLIHSFFAKSPSKLMHTNESKQLLLQEDVDDPKSSLSQRC